MEIKTLVERWDDVSSGMRTLAAAIPAGKEGFRPAPGAMALAEQVLQCASAERTVIDALTVTPGEWVWNKGYNLENYPTIDAVLAVYDRQREATRRFLESLDAAKLAQVVKTPWGAEWTLERLWWEWIVHQAHHRGSLVVGLRVAGVEPPNIWG